MERVTSVVIRPEYGGQTVLDFLAGRFTYRSRAGWQQELAAGRFQLADGRPVTASTRLAVGARLTYLPPELPEPPVNTGYAVLYEDADLLVVDKPGNLPCHPAGRFFRHTLWALLKDRPGLAQPSLINRLDRETSGLVLVAKHQEAARRCYRQFAERQVYKGYLVLVEGEFPAAMVEAAGWLDADPASVVRKKVRFYPAGPGRPATAKECSTNFSRLAGGNGISLLAATPLTGRCHQIRATLCSLGYPVVGDKIYGVDEQLFLRFQQGQLSVADQARLRLDRQALHAAELGFCHPGSGRQLNFTSPPPPAFRELLQKGF